MADRHDIDNAMEDAKRAAVEFARRMYQYRSDDYRLELPMTSTWVGVCDNEFGIWRRDEYRQWYHCECESATSISDRHAVLMLENADEIEDAVRTSAAQRYEQLRSLVDGSLRRAALSYCYG